METLDILKELSNAVCVGEINEAEKKATEMLSRSCEIRNAKDGSFYGFMDFHKEKTLLFDAHIDEIALTVTAVSENGFLKVSKMGGIDPRMLPAQRVNVWGKELVKGTFISVPPHLKKGKIQPTFDDLYIDIGIFENVAEIVPVGSVVTFDVESTCLQNGFFSGKSIDNRASVTALIKAAEIIAEKGISNYNLAFLFSRQEELGLRGVQTAVYDIQPDECICVDVTFGDLPGIPAHKTGVVGSGPMLGISPILSKNISENIKDAAAKSDSKIQFEIMGGKTSTNADVISISRSGIETGLISIPIRNMHTPTEVVCLSDIDSVANILAEYVKGGSSDV